MLLGEPIDAQEAYRIGLANKVVPKDKLMEEARIMAGKLAAKAPLALRLAKDAVDYGVGDRVRHVKFGDGTVKDMVQGKRDYEVTVEFDTVGVKKLFAAFAGLKKI